MWLLIGGMFLVFIGLILTTLLIAKDFPSFVLIICVTGIIIASGLLFIILSVDSSASGYPAINTALQENGVYEVIYIKENLIEEKNQYIVLMKTPDDSFRLFKLSQHPPLGFVKVYHNNILLPLLPWTDETVKPTTPPTKAEE